MFIVIYIYSKEWCTHVLCLGRSGTVIICRCTSVILRFFSKLHITSQRQSSKLNTWTPTISNYYFNLFYIRYGNQTWQWKITRFSSWHSHVFLPIYSGFPVAIITGVLIGRDRLKGRPSAMSAVYRSSKTRFHKSSFKALFTQSRFSPQNYFDILWSLIDDLQSVK